MSPPDFRSPAVPASGRTTDGYGDNNLYKVSNTGTLSRTVTVLNAVNDDWEDLCHDVSRTWLYIGDFGNNDCDRTNLRIYRVPYPSYVSGTTVTAEEISFTFPDQHAVPSPWMNFDVEAFFHFNGHLYLFTKADGDGKATAVGMDSKKSAPSAIAWNRERGQKTSLLYPITSSI